MALLVNNRQYRPEIDGLRALAVIGVVLFHMGLGFTGGFVGVDVFFVISGYLITGIILRELESGSFSMLDFWVKRIRRILPACLVMVVATLLVGKLLLSAAQHRELVDVAIAQSLMFSNLLFAQEVDYFAEGANVSALLHTWSLAVEEQFYIVFPLLLLAMRGASKRVQLVYVIAIVILSFAWSSFQLGRDPQSTFFLLPSRAWELLVGALLAFQGKLKVGKKFAEVLALVGLGLIIFAMLHYDEHSLFPGTLALVPVAGAVLFIFANQHEMTVTGRALSWRPVVFIGLISYSLYLWHWPVVVFAQSIFTDLGTLQRVGCMLLSFVLAICSWRFIEQPFRQKKWSSLSRWKVLASAGTVTAALVLGLTWYKSVSVNVSEQDTLLADVDWTGAQPAKEREEVIEVDTSEVVIHTSPIGASEGDVDFMLWGDSHAMAASATIDRLAKKYDLRGEALYRTAIQPLTGVFFYTDTKVMSQELLLENEAVVQGLIRNKIPNVVLVARWVACCVGFNEAEMVGNNEVFRLGPMMIDTLGDTPNSELSSAVMKRQLTAMCERLDAAGVKVWIMRQVPETIHLNTAQRVANFKRFPEQNELSPFTITREQHEQRRSMTNKVFEGLKAQVFDPTDEFFRENGRLRIYDERAYYRDDDHVTRAGAERYLSPVLEEMFSKMFKQ